MNLTITPSVTNNKTKTAKVNKQQSFGMNLGASAKETYALMKKYAPKAEWWALAILGKPVKGSLRVVIAGIDSLGKKAQPKYELCKLSYGTGSKAEGAWYEFGIKDLSDDTIVERTKSPKGAIKFLRKLHDDTYVEKLMEGQRNGSLMQRLGRFIGIKPKQTITVKKIKA